MGAEDPQILIMRGEDLVVLGVRWSDFVPADGPSTGAELVAAEGAKVVLTFPPQHVAEEVTFGSGLVTAPRQARLSGTSEIVFGVAVGSRMALTAEGVLTACAAGRILPGPAGPDGDRTAIEISWRLIVSPENRRSASLGVIGAHRVRPVASPSGAVGLWQTRLRAADESGAGADDAGLVLVPVDAQVAGTADPGFAIPLTTANRLRIFQEGRVTPPPARRLELTSVGGSLSARGRWETFSWEHESVLGRDMTVRLVSQGVLYPTGHRAQLVDATARTFAARPDGQAEAMLHTSTTLVVTEPVRGPSPEGELRRAFPFDSVEITTTRFDLARTGFVEFGRPSPELAVIQVEIARAEEALEAALTAVLEAVFGPGATTADIVPASVDQFIDGIIDLPPDATSAPAGFDEASTYVRLRDELEFLQLMADGEPFEMVPLFCRPQTTDGLPLRVPVHCVGGGGDLRFSLPVLFVNDVRLPADGFVPAFDALSHPEVAAILDRAYGTSGAVELAGAPVEFLQGGNGQRREVHEVHRMTIVGVPQGGGFRPRIGRRQNDRDPGAPPGLVVALPALRTLLQDTRHVPMDLTEEFLDRGEAEDVVFRIAGQAVDVTFTGKADRSGGLVSPSFTADGISRTRGPVSVEGLRSDAEGALAPDKVFGPDATLLGFPLREIVRTLRKPPTIVSDLIAGQQPTVRLEWTEVALKSLPPLEATEATKLDLSVESSASRTVTTCTLSDFSLLLPGKPLRELLELKFGSLTFRQEAGHPPKLEVLAGPTGAPAIDAVFLGPLRLLQELGDVVDFGQGGPTVHASSSGITARYALPLPNVTSGAFTLRNIVFQAGITVPFDGKPVTVTLAFASRENPFNLSVLMFGGGGYIVLEVDNTGLRRLEASLEFGASVAVDFFVASGEVHAFGGLRYVQQSDGSILLSGFLRIGGSVEILGLVSVSIELLLTLNYDSDKNRMFGQATIVVEIDLFLYSDSVEIDSGEWVLIGGDDSRSFRDVLRFPDGRTVARVEGAGGLEEWRRYREAFATR